MLTRAGRHATGAGLAAGTIAVAVVGFPVAYAAGVAMYVALHHTEAGRAWFELMDRLATDDTEDEPEEQAA